ncbi:hypothetical protein GCM10010123_23490 [Pilimelia anulata]|uniref:non-specific serine/threonine protein kinase n=1 Tax=Pilimelia anulata TaxID=53371 RepID=A0A8J3FCS1_9ACTN|nr:serine/threonine-protein kinase [Pilimelia anulata]GGJ92940.1 hypothetical protein GCM10010123_23490 [Pilimelia anulata]
MTQIPTWNGRTAPGTTIGGRYTVRAVIGHGGMGTVWQATDTLLHRDVAVKEVVPPASMAASDREAMYARTLREARAAACLSHPSVVQVYDVVTEHDRPWIIMELLDARSLADIIVGDGPLAPRAVAKTGIALLGALEVAHAAGILHRDVKPANVLIAADGRCVLTDFGVAHMPTGAQLTTPGMVLGSPHFISPERAIGQSFGPPSDLFSLGVTLYTAVEGRPPFDRGDPIETMHAVVEEPPAPLLRAGPLGGVLMGLLEKDPSRRTTVDEARSTLRELLAGALASTAPAFAQTDPYAVVPAQRMTSIRRGRPAPEAPAKPGGGIGGRAMLGPGESLAERVRSGRTAPARPTAAPVVDVPTGAHPAPTPEPITRTTGQLTRIPRTRPAGAGPGRAAADAGLGARVRPFAGRAVRAVRRSSRQTRLAAAAGVAGLLLIAGAVAVFDGDDGAPSVRMNRPAPVAAQFATQRYDERGVNVNVPRGWRRSSAGNWVDFADPRDDQRKIRILVERADADPLRFMEIAESGLRRTATCADPYARLGLRSAGQGKRRTAELEYTCGSGDRMRHGLWRAVTVNGQAYSFYLTVPEERFDESKKIFEEMARTFRVA